MIHNVFEFGETEIKEIMTPRIHVESIPDDCSYQELIGNFINVVNFHVTQCIVNHLTKLWEFLNVKDLLFL